MEFIDRAMSVKMPVELLIEANKRHVELDSDDRSEMAAWIFAWIKMLDEYDYSEEARTDLLLAIQFRISALCRFELGQHPETAGWILPGEDGLVYTSYTVFQAAAEHPLTTLDDKVCFEPISFLQRLQHIAVFRSFDSSESYNNY